MKAFWPFLCMIVLLLPTRSATAQEAGTIASIVGKADVFRAGQWQPAKLRQSLLPGDVVRTGPGSRVAILLADESQIKVNANSTFAIKQVGPAPGRPVPAALGFLQTILNLLSGEIWIRSRVQPFEIQTPAATATIRGTEMNLSIVPANAARLAVLDGAVEFRNLQGSVLVAAGEQATAKIGEAPRKSVLVNPLDAVQWSFYYPGIVSFRDYPLTAIGPALLPQRLSEAESRVAAAPGNLEPRIELGEILFDLGRRAEARREFESALRIAPQDPRAHAGLGWINLVEGKVEAALGEFRQAQPPPLPALVGMTNALYRLDRFEEAEAVIAEAKRRFPSSPQPLTQAALLHLIQGRVAEALSELEQALALDPRYALAHGLLSNIYLVQNKKGLALQAAQQAVVANPFSPSAHLDLSLVKQAEFRLEEALQAAQKAVALDPEDPQALIQVSRLLFGMGRLSEAFKVAEQARRRAPQDPLVNTTWGFFLLARGKVQEAITAFDQAIQADSTRGEPHLGRGLGLFRQGKMEAAVQEMQMATLLEPQVSLFHSYLGKAFYEVKRDEPARDEFVLAKGLDPRDPTPWFYDAIRKQSVNRPVEALYDLQKAIELNDNRAVYRSRLLLDEDLAARGATLARIYNELGFQQLALVEGWKSLNVDPTNYSAHRLLADSYAFLPRHGIARVSELLQSQLFQPINIAPVQPQLAETELFILEGAGPIDPSLNEFNPLFVRNRFALLASGLVGGNDTLGDEIVHSGVWGRLSYSLGQFHHETDGFRENNDLKQDLYNAFVQVTPSYNTSVQAEFRHTETKEGDRGLRFFPDDFIPVLRQDRKTETGRLGFHHAFAPGSDIIASLIYKDVDATFRDQNPRFRREAALDEESLLAEGQYLFRSEGLHVISGAGHFTTANRRQVIMLGRFRPVVDENDIRHTNLYMYSQLNYLKSVTVTLGVSSDFFRGTLSPLTVDRDQVNPKVGLTWTPFPSTTLRAAVFRVLNTGQTSAQTVEPTQVAGFNQFFGATFEQDFVSAFFPGIDAWRYGVGIDHKFSPRLHAGSEFSKQDLEVPGVRLDTGKLAEENWDEYLARAYLYWTPHPWLAASAEYQFERFERGGLFGAGTGIGEVNTHRLPLGISFFHPSGLSVRLKATYLHQDGKFAAPLFDLRNPFKAGNDHFWLVDTAIRYRLAKRRGFITLGVENLFGETFKFQELDPATPTIQRDRLIFGRVTLAF